MEDKKFQIKESITPDNVSLPIVLNSVYDVLLDDAVNYVEVFEATNENTHKNVTFSGTPSVYNGVIKTASSSNKITNFLGVLNKNTNKVDFIQFGTALMINQIINHSNIDDVSESITKRPNSEVELAKNELIGKFSGEVGVQDSKRMESNADRVSEN